MIGETVSHYRIIGELGSGGMGVVYKAEDTKLGRTVALKFLTRALTSDADAKERFLREARAVCGIDHPNICTIHEVDETDSGATFICMACYEGRSLKERLKAGPLQIAEAIEVAVGIARGLRAAHAAGIVHRDIKPGNVMLTEPSTPRIIDFGLAKLSGRTSITAAGSALGTIAYMSPEQARGGEVDARTDIWSLGVVLYEMVAGRPPFEGDHDQAVIHSILNAVPPPLSRERPGVPPELDAIVRKALAKDPAARYQNAATLVDDLRALTRVLDSAADATARTWGFADPRRRAALRATAVVALCVAAGAVAWGALRGRDGGPMPTGRPLRVTAASGWEDQPAVSPDGARIAYVSDESGNYDIHVTDVRGGSTLRLTDDPAIDDSPAWLPDGTAIVFVSDRNGRSDVWKVSQFGGGATLLVEDAEFPAISPDGARIAFARVGASGWRRIHVAPLSSPSSAEARTGDSDGVWDHYAPAWSPDGRTICYATRHNLWTVPADGGAPRPLTDVGAGDASPAWSSDGRHVYFSSNRGGTTALWRVPRRGGRPERLTAGSGFEGEPSVSRDGSKLAYSSATTETDIIVADRKTGVASELPVLKGTCMGAFVPGTEDVVFVSTQWGARAELGALSLRGATPTGTPRRLTDQPGEASQPSVSRDGRWIAYYRIVGGERDLWALPAGGGAAVRLTDDPASDIHPAWSPDGKALAFASDREGTWDIWVLPMSNGRPGGEPRRLTRGEVSAYAPAWAPDGTEIVFIGADTSERDVWSVTADGSGPARRVTAGIGAVRVRWDPTATRLLVSALNGTDRVTLWSLPPTGGRPAAVEPVVDFGPMSAEAVFDVSQDGERVLFQRQTLRGDVWVLEAKKGTY
ncbi:MAG: PD40 domain-containing protein [Candidatus Eisenbacteria bacterium]|nr:PD40 domain-containing protein [Candidatus Eisenbacteria bacterium]